MKVCWRCHQCGNTYDFVHKDGQQQAFSEVLRLAREEGEGVWRVTLYCPTCDESVGTVQFPTGDPSPLLVDGNVNIFYYFEPIDVNEAKVVREIPVVEGENASEGL